MSTSNTTNIGPPPMTQYTQLEFAEAFVRLLPTGPAWATDFNSQLRIALYPLANTYATNETLAQNLLIDIFPSTSVQLIPEWNESLGLPGPCSIGSSNVAVSQSAIVAQINNQGGVSEAYYISYALSMGYVITISNYSSLRIGHDINQSCYDRKYDFIWIVTIVSGAVPSYLECMLRQIAPAHLQLYVIYPDSSIGLPGTLTYPIVSVVVSGTTANFSLTQQYTLLAAVNYSGTGTSGTVIFLPGSQSQAVTVPSAVSLTLSNTYHCALQ